ncbi:MAG: sigma-70 family RNA polymerase sigma factor [Verrucomicrobia bacterium]|nr:sigma-70 family RNA polymerase sigma factor [Verrucomicrobiota bacterium]
MSSPPTANPDFTRLFERVLVESHGDVRGYLSALGVPVASVDDLAQEAYLAWYRAPDQRPEEVEPVRWLKGIARRMALNFFRTSKRAEERHASVVAELLATEPMELPLRADDDAAMALEQCLEKLPDKQRTVLRLSYEDNLTSHDVAARLDMTASAVRILLMRLRDALRDCITQRLGEETR